MPKYAIHTTFFFFVLTALTGVLMRTMLLFPQLSFTNYGFILHGHSHMAILGWTFLAVFIIFLRLTWQALHIKAKKQAIAIIITAFVVTFGMFIAFLIQGYALYSIILSTAHIGVEYWMAFFIYKQLKTHHSLPRYSTLFMKGAIFSLLLSSIGPLSLGGLAMAGLKASPLFEMAIYFYLHFQYNGWLYLSLFSMFLYLLYTMKITLNTSLLTYSFWIYLVALFPGFALSILWFGLGKTGLIFAIIGAVGQFTGIILLFIALIKQRTAINSVFSKHICISLIFTFLLLICKSVMEFGLLYEPLAGLVFETRSVVIGYLHLTLLGFISIFILTQYQMTQLLDETKKRVLYGIGIFIFGFIINELILFLLGLADWFHIKLVYHQELLLLASLLLLLGIMMIWSSFIVKKEQ